MAPRSLRGLRTRPKGWRESDGLPFDAGGVKMIELVTVMEELIHEYIALAIATQQQPRTYRRLPALVEAARLVAKARGQT